MVITLAPTSTRRFNPDNVDVCIAGQDAVGAYNGYIQEKPTLAPSGALTIVTKSFKAVDSPVISTAAFNGYLCPVAGDLPYGKEQLTAADGCPITIESIHWANKNTGMTQTGPFVHGQSYTVTVKVKTLSPAVFADSVKGDCNNGYFYPTVYVADTHDSALITFTATAFSNIQINAANFPDATFRGYVKDRCDTNGNNRLDPEEIMATTEIDVSKKGNTLTDLTGIEMFTNLERLDCSDTWITDLLLNSRKLKYVNAARCKLTHFRMYTDAVEVLDLQSNNFTLMTIGTWPVLKELYVQNNPGLTSIAVNGCAELETLYAWDCAVTNLNIQGLQKLNHLSIHGNSGLTELNLTTNPLLMRTVLYGDADMSAYQRYTALNNDSTIELVTDKALSLITGSGIAINEANFPDGDFRDYVWRTFDRNNDDHLDAEEIAAATEIRSYDGTFTDLTGIENLTALKKIIITPSDVKKIDVKGFTDLETLILDEGLLQEIDVSGMQKLKTLSVEQNKLRLAHFNDCPALEFVYLNDNPDLTDYQMDNDAAISELRTDGTGIWFLDLSDTPLLRSLVEDGDKDVYAAYDEYNGPEGVLTVVKDTDFTGITAIEINSFYFPDEHLRAWVKDYDLNGNGYFSEKKLLAVDELEICELNIASLEGIQFFTNLNNLNVSANSLTSLDVSFLPHLKTLMIDDLPITEFTFDREGNSIQFLSCGQTQITDWSFLAYMKDLKELDIMNSGMTDPSPFLKVLDDNYIRLTPKSKAPGYEQARSGRFGLSAMLLRSIDVGKPPSFRERWTHRCLVT